MSPTDGILVVNKPAAWTSHDVVAFVRRRSGIRRVGHAGTLDPAATGVLPLLLGRATRLAEYLADATKAYVATVELGVETDTYDTDGNVVARKDASHITREQIDAALDRFRGDFDQLPPAFSAIKREGVALYKRARRGEDVALTPRRVRVEQLDIISYGSPNVQLSVDCAKGFYVRSLAHDLGAALGVGGMLASLVRTRVGAFRIQDAVDLETLRAELEAGTWTHRLFAPDEVLLSWQAAILGEVNEAHLRHGRSAVFDTPASAERCRAYSATGDFLAVLQRTGASDWRPAKVFFPAH